MDSNIKNTVGKIGFSYGLAEAGVGYVCIPRNYDRDIYIKNCLANNTLCLRTENFEFLTDVYTDKIVLQNIDFPQDRNENGSLVVWVRVAKHGVPIAIGVINLKNKGQEILKENTFTFIRKDNNGNTVSIVGDPLIGLNVDVVNNEESGGINLKVLNKYLQAAVNFYVQGNVNFDIEKTLSITLGEGFNFLIKDPSKNNKKTTISYKFGEGLNIIDEFKNNLIINQNGVQVKVPSGKKIEIGTGENNEPAVLGDKLNDSLNKIIDCFNDINNSVDAAKKVATGGSAAPFNVLSLGLNVMSAHLIQLKELILLNNSKTVVISP